MHAAHADTYYGSEAYVCCSNAAAPLLAQPDGNLVHNAQSVSEWEAFVGGFLMIFGSRIASGCTSGHGLSGMALLSLKSIIAVC